VLYDSDAGAGGTVSGALSGYRVIELGHYIAGPLTGMLLADQGADVIRIDEPGERSWDHPANAAWNRGKRSIVLDLKRADDLATARELIAGADALIENFRPGVMDRLGLRAEAMIEANRGLVYCSLPGFAEDDPRAAQPAWEGVIKAASGAYRRNREGDPPGAPVYTALPIASTFGAEQAVIAITMALLARERDGLGQRVSVPLFDAMFAAIGYQGIRLHTPVPRSGGGAVGLGGTFRCADGRWIYFGTGNDNTSEVLAAIGASDWIAEGFFDGARVAAEPSLRDELRRRAAALFLTRDAEEWEAVISVAGGECAVCREASEWLRHPAAIEAGIVIERDDPHLGRTRQPGLAVWASRTPGAVRGPAPRPDQDRATVLTDLARRPVLRKTQADAPRRPVLDGVRVLDLCIVLAGPTCGRTLAEYGADVIKIEAPTRPPSPLFHLDVNRGKRSMVLDLKEPAGLEVFWRLVEDADVLVQNFRNGVAERLGVGYEQIRARRPNIVYASLNMYGQEGALAERPGHEQFAQAATGMQARYGAGGAPQLQRLAVTDYGTGYLGAYGVALALLHRARTGEGQHVATSLSHTATLLQSPFMVDYEGASWDEPRGQGAIGDGPLHRAYAASDGWFWFGARRSDLVALGTAIGRPGIDALAGDALAEALAERFAAETVDAWVTRLVAAGCAASPYVHDLAMLMQDPWVVTHGLSVTRDHGDRGVITHPGPAPRLSDTPLIVGCPTPNIGDDTFEILDELGLGARAEELRAVLTARGGSVDTG
jgi:crotonobetainyl-CoA:carnitine CoA-transferase CaiB-like acyl-CoA transferase